MGWLSSISGWVTRAADFLSGRQSVSGGSASYISSTAQRIYEPIETAVIEQQSQLQLADKDAERIELMKAAKLEIMQEEAELQIALEKSRREGFEQMTSSIVKLQETLTVIAQKRLQIIEQGSLDIVRQAETFYQEIQADLTAKSEEFSLTKLPQMLDILQRYEEGSSAHQLYSKQVMALVDNQFNLLTQQTLSLANRQQTVIEGIINSKNHIISHTDSITSRLIEQASLQSGLSADIGHQTSPMEGGVSGMESHTVRQLLPAPELAK